MVMQPTTVMLPIVIYFGYINNKGVDKKMQNNIKKCKRGDSQTEFKLCPIFLEM